MTESLTMYTTPWCGYCVRLKHQLKASDLAYTEVDISLDPAAALLVETINGGNQTVPTVVLPDGTALTNPSLAQIKSGLAQA